MDWLLAVVVLPPTMIVTTLVLAGIERRLLHGGRPPRAPARPPVPRPSGEQAVVHRE
ncbi:hypothetical protein [Actinomycetospora sp. TBRC 11914]|uniref:hypothetical protein n=1 Tax=Actinomycetospora sp. TBRC 11914 TaxID=2729387 RepID=UPI00145E7873|nr:hypothetical protein [Actinomycetospora sp. TBRC 11914]NMO91304.1 hypothetical protein [Actinomycetospora sp. TBRC 11914]